ncbi:hypothetical protein CTA2_10626 [Colletotrichum tanaceti]|uniref:Uncharacterized protein n=1 Tax=Colletotrichum tanaceti TaxID=1306861 RepID=A0A4U6XB32_9PEZI|nr:hypothetical protein CTA2_10626 [Colletotrichum tanaceti]TKW52898.1 hypothetical protein CTA1_12075 [Colletotrichum tanaceti]
MALKYQTEVGLAIAAVFICLNVLYFGLESAIPAWARINSKLQLQRSPSPLVKKARPLVDKAQYFAPLLIVLLGIILIPFLFVGERDHQISCNKPVDADIAGRGIRFAAWTQIGVLLFVALLGTFHNNATMAKEIGAGLVVTHLSLNIALLISRRDINRTTAEVVLGSMMLDAQNSALSIPLVTKETLAARWQVVVTVVCQGLGLAVLGVILHDISDDRFVEDCQCVEVAWWGDVGAGDDNCDRQDMRAMWIYYSCRLVSFAQSSFHSLMNMEAFHEAENQSGGEGTLKDLTFPQVHSKPQSWLENWIPRPKKKGHAYDKYMSTVSLAYLVYGMFAITSMVAAECAMAKIKPSGVEKITIGQAIAIVVAGATILRVVWLLHKVWEKPEEWKIPPPIKDFIGRCSKIYVSIRRTLARVRA